MPDPGGSTSPDLPSRLAARAGKLRLLVASLAGPSLRARYEIDDFVQETFVRVLGARGAFETQRSPTLSTGTCDAEDVSPSPAPTDAELDDAALDRHLALVARHVVIDAARALRAAKREGDRSAAPLAGSSSGGSSFGGRIAAHSPGPRTRAAGRELSQDLVAAYLRLTPEHRRVLGLRQFQGLTAQECALRMGRSEVAVHSLYRRALEAWGAALGGEPTR